MKLKFNQITETLKRHQTLVVNFGYLTILQAYSVVLPLLTIPYLLRVLGTDNYGLLIYVQAVIQYFVIIVNFGFNISGTKDISIHRRDKLKISEIVSSVLIVKVLLFILSFILLGIAVLVIPVLKEHYLLVFLSMSICLSEVIFPVWYFQGIEKMRYITIINVISRTFFAACIFIFIKEGNQYLLVPVFNGLGALIGGFVALWIVFRKEKVKFAFQKIEIIWSYVKDSAPLFLTRASAQVYVKTNIVVIGSVLGMAEAGFYDLALKIINVLAMPFNSIKTTIFPKVSKDLDLNFVHKAIKVVLVIAIFSVLGVQFFSPYAMTMLIGENNDLANSVLRLLSLILIAMVMSGFFGEQLLIPFGFKKDYVKGMVCTAVFYFGILSVLYLFNLLNLHSIVLMVVATEFFLSASFLVSCRRHKLL